MIKNIVFDIGNVLFGYDPNHLLNQLLPENPFHKNYLIILLMSHGKNWIVAINEDSLIDMLVNKIPIQI